MPAKHELCISGCAGDSVSQKSVVILNGKEDIFEMTNYFTRELDLANCSLEIYQQLEGDVGCVVWDAAICLAKYIDLKATREKYEFHRKRVIELGSGTGVVGLAATLHGAKVTITDLPEFVPLMQKNVKHNESKFENETVQAASLKWGEDLANFKETYDIILMADLIYYEESLVPLVDTMVALASSNTIILMSYEERSTGNKPQLQKKFFELAGKNFAIKTISREEQDPIYNSEDIHLYEMRLKR